METILLINYINRKKSDNIELPYPSVIQSGKLTFTKWYERNIDEVEIILVNILDALDGCGNLSDYIVSFDKPNIIWDTVYLIYLHSSNTY